MKIKVALMRVISLSLLFTIASCGGGPDYPKREYSIVDYAASAVQYQEPIDENYPADSAVRDVREASVVASGDVVDWSHFSIKVTSTIKIDQIASASLPRLSLFSRAIASSPGIPTAKQRLSGISITSDNSYTDAYPAGTELSSLLGPIHNPFYEHQYKLSTHGVYVYLPLAINTMADLSGRNLPAPVYFKIKLLVAPQYSRQNFQIKITLDDGSVFTLLTGNVYLAAPNP